MKIGIDAHGVGGHSFGLGNETYALNLISHLLDLDGDSEYHIFVNHPEAVEDAVAGHRNVRLVSLRPHSQWIQRPISLPAYAWRNRLDVVHVPFVRPPMIRTRTIVTVHDADYEVHPSDFTFVERWRMKMLVRPSCRRADMIFTVSEFARRQIHELYGVPYSKIAVTYNAADHIARPVSEPQALRHFELPYPCIFFVGMIQPKKNLPNLVRAFEVFKYRTRLPHHLVLVGKWGWRNEELQAVLAASPFRAQICFPGYMTSQEIATYLPRADAFVFPSLYESFGIPPMEAQRLGVPVLVSNSTCFPEIYGDSALYCDPYSVESIAAGLERVLKDQPLRANLIRRGFENVRRFSWRESARTALAAYRRVAAGGTPTTEAPAGISPPALERA